MRCDIAGNLYITCLGVNDGKVIKVSPKGKILKEIMTINKPTNLTFGGPDGRTCYVTTSGNSLEVFRVDLPGRLWKRH